MTKRSRFIVRNVGSWHIIDSHDPQRSVVASHHTKRKADIAARALNIMMAEALPCPMFRPDHNGECLNCDEWMDAHSAEAIAAGERFASMSNLQHTRGTKKS